MSHILPIPSPHTNNKKNRGEKTHMFYLYKKKKKQKKQGIHFVLETIFGACLVFGHSVL